MKKIMFLCTANSCRSQIAEGFARQLGKGFIEPYSAGLFSSRVHPRAIEVMNEIGIDISNQKSKDIDEELLKNMDIIITLCGHAEASCPMTPPEVKRIHWPINDPVSTIGTEEEIKDAFRKARDKIKSRIESLVQEMNYPEASYKVSPLP
jgi:arsenate reductase